MSLPELIEIKPLAQPVKAEITVPGSKSITNRALILAALANGTTTLQGALWSEDTQAMVDCLQKLGFTITVAPDENEFCNRTITIQGLSGKIPNAGTPQKPLELFVGNAGTAARFLTAFVCLGTGVYRLSGVPRMHERPQEALFKALRELGYQVESEKGNDKLPVKITGNANPPKREIEPLKTWDHKETVSMSFMVTSELNARKRLRSCTISIEQSSQFASALFLCANVGGWLVNVIGESIEESPYVVMTTELIKIFPQSGGEFYIEPDASSGSYFWSAGTILSWAFRVERQIVVVQWPESNWQIDSRFRDYSKPSVSFASTSRRNELGDSIMTAIVMAPIEPQNNPGPKKFTDLGRLRLQETERVRALRKELYNCGAKVEEIGDTLMVYPSELHDAEIETYNDHRMAMCFAVLGLKVPGIKIRNPACVKKTFPNFFQKLAAAPPHGLGAVIVDAHTQKPLTGGELFAD